MKKISILMLLCVFSFKIHSIVAYNNSFDPGLIEKNGVFDFNKYLFDNYIMGFASHGLSGADGSTVYDEAGAKLHLRYAPDELKGFYFNADLYMSKITAQKLYGDAADWWGGNMPFFGETYFGFQSKIFDFSFGFQNLKSSDTIYHNVMIDSYSGAFFSYKSNLMITKYFDFQVAYNFIRFHQGPWYNGDVNYDYTYMNDQWKEHTDDLTSPGFFQPKYGKSLYFHKINIRPAPWIRFGLMETVFFLGENINPYFANPVFLYFAMAMIDQSLAQKYGSNQGTDASSIMLGFDFNIGFDGWRLYGEMIIDDANGEYVTFDQPNHPDRLGFVIGGELRGYLFDKYLSIPRNLSFFVSNLFVNLEFAVVSRYTYSRDHLFYYEYVRQEYPYTYYPAHFKDKLDGTGNLIYPDYVAYTEAQKKRTNREGNFLGYMYGNNADSFDIAFGWRNDLFNVNDSTAGYIVDRYYESQKKRLEHNRLFKIQFHYRRYRLGEYRDVTVPYYLNQHVYYDLDPFTDLDGDGDPTNDRTNLTTGFVDLVVEQGDIFDINVYADIVRFNRFVLGVEGKAEFKWVTAHPQSSLEKTDFVAKFDIGLILGF